MSELSDGAAAGKTLIAVTLLVGLPAYL